MFSISIKTNETINEILASTVNTINGYIKTKLSKKTSLISDEKNVNITSGNILSNRDANKVVAEINFKYEFLIDKDKLEDKEELDKFIFYIKKCISNLSDIEKEMYIPLHMRGKTDDRWDQFARTWDEWRPYRLFKLL